MKIINYILLTGIVLCSVSCATILTGGSPDITINSNYTDPVTITTTKGVYYDVKLPYTVKVKRAHLAGQHIIVQNETDRLGDIVLSSQFNAWFLGNLLIGGIPGMIIDLATSSVTKPSQTYYYITVSSELMNRPTRVITTTTTTTSEGVDEP